MIDVHAHFTTQSCIETAKSSGHRQPDGMPEWYWPERNPQTHRPKTEILTKMPEDRPSDVWRGLEPATNGLQSPGS
jgi:hypothetical protein